MSNKDAIRVKSPRTGLLVDIDDMSREELMEYCAWNTETELGLLWQFIEKFHLVGKADEFLSTMARDEIREGQS